MVRLAQVLAQQVPRVTCGAGTNDWPGPGTLGWKQSALGRAVWGYPISAGGQGRGHAIYIHEGGLPVGQQLGVVLGPSRNVRVWQGLVPPHSCNKWP